MTHNNRCEYAKGDLCRCECQGDLHGIKEKKEVNKEENKEINHLFETYGHLISKRIELEKKERNSSLFKWMEVVIT